MDTRKYRVTYRPSKGDSTTSKLYFTISEPDLIAQEVPALNGTYDETDIINQVMRQFKDSYSEITAGDTTIIPEVISISQVPAHDTSNVDPYDIKLMKVMTKYDVYADSMEELLSSLIDEGEAFTDEELQHLIDRAGDTEHLAPEDLRHIDYEALTITRSGYLKLTENNSQPNGVPIYLKPDLITGIIGQTSQPSGYTEILYGGQVYTRFLVHEDAGAIIRCLDRYMASNNGQNND